MLAPCSVRSGARPSLRALRAPALLGALLLVLVPPGGCTTVQPTTGVDTCNQGLTFQEPHLSSFGVDASGVATVELAWYPGTERGQELPQDYFAAVRAEGAVSAALTATNQITVVLGDLSERLAVSTMVRVMLLRPAIASARPRAYDSSRASMVISALSRREIGQPALALLAAVSKPCASIPGTRARTSR
jgi:hypothetical protein